MNEKLRLRNMIREDVGKDIEDNEALVRTVQQLQRWETPEVAPETMLNLIELLAAELPQTVGTAPHPNQIEAIWNSWALLLLRSQLRVVSRELWLASALVMALGTVVTLATYNPSIDGMLPLVLLAPVVTAAGIAFVYGPLNDPALEVELAAPISPRLIALARITLVFCFNLGLGLIGSAVLVLSGSGLTFAPVVAAWLAPMAFLSSLAFLLSVVFFDPLISALFSGVLWMMMNMRNYMQLDIHPLLELIPNLLTADARPLIWLMAVVLMGAALWLVGQDERWLGAQG
jgi:hypothetical protein